MDTNKYSILLLDLEADSLEGEHLTNAGHSFTYGGTEYLNAEGLKIKLPTIGGTLGKDECKIEGVKIEDSFLIKLSNHYPYSKVEVTIRELDINVSTDAVEAVRTLFKGLVYQAMPMPLKGYLSITANGWKYYTDITAGVPCTEQCAWGVLGNKGCGATVIEEGHVVDSVSGHNLTIVDSLTNTTAFLFNKGYIERGGARIKIKYHESGKTFQMEKAPPSDWVGKDVTVYSGCDRQLATCRNIYNNEERFLGLGIAMVDYNPFYENP